MRPARHARCHAPQAPRKRRIARRTSGGRLPRPSLAPPPSPSPPLLAGTRAVDRRRRCGKSTEREEAKAKGEDGERPFGEKGQERRGGERTTVRAGRGKETRIEDGSESGPGKRDGREKGAQNWRRTKKNRGERAWGREGANRPGGDREETAWGGELSAPASRPASPPLLGRRALGGRGESPVRRGLRLPLRGDRDRGRDRLPLRRVPSGVVRERRAGRGARRAVRAPRARVERRGRLRGRRRSRPRAAPRRRGSRRP